MKIPMKTVFAWFLVLVMVFSMVPVTASATSSSDIKKELDELKSENKKIQAEINAIQSKYDANASEMQVLVDKKTAVDQEIGLLNNQIININAQITAYGL